MKKDIQEKTKKLAEVKKTDEKLANRLKQVKESIYLPGKQNH